MTTIKLTSSKKALQVIDDFGRVYICPISFVKDLIYGNGNRKFITMNRMTGLVDPKRYPVSPVYDPNGVGIQEPDGDITNSNDVFSRKAKKNSEQSKNYSQNFKL